MEKKTIIEPDELCSRLKIRFDSDGDLVLDSGINTIFMTPKQFKHLVAFWEENKHGKTEAEGH